MVISIFLLSSIQKSCLPKRKTTRAGWQRPPQEIIASINFRGPCRFVVALDGTISGAIKGQEKQLEGLFTSISSNIYPIKNNVVVDIDGIYIHVPNVPETTCAIIAWYNEKLEISTPAKVLEWAQTNAPGTQKSLTVVPVRSDTLNAILRFTGDNIHRATITALARANEWQDGENCYKELAQEYKNLKITVSLPNGDKAASLWEFLQRGGAATVKAHYALWAG